MLRPLVGSLFLGSLMLAQQAHAASMIIEVVDANNFCTFLPPSDSVDRIIADSETEAQAFCLGNTPSATGSEPMPSNFIQSAHYVATDAYVQVTGQIDPTKDNLDLTDGGGQYDIKAPDGASCAGWDYFVNLVEPQSYTYCVRCCKSASDCNRGISEAGCEKIVPGDYSGPLVNGSLAVSSAGVSSATVSSSMSSSMPAATSSSETSPSSSRPSSPSISSNSPKADSGNSMNSNESGAVTAQSVDDSGAGVARPTFAILAAVFFGAIAVF
ncbi:hypothetical protein BX666DRAFT_1237817 [Dichotomocladium elegans]|nr:hypothetical protein BX666DRAFT_1237817 [Dichotomocladium elegans]